MKKTNNNIKCAIYARLSNEDQYESKSVSIETQISICSEYAKNNNLIVKEILYDDGYSGTNFNRPSFQKLIELIETKTINCLIIKDLSRLGRNFLKVSEFVEDYFPKKNIRLIILNHMGKTVKMNKKKKKNELFLCNLHKSQPLFDDFKI